jgi:SAM-dependent methyltransferase
MGFDSATIEFLAGAKALGISLDRVLTLGRQSIHVKPKEVRSIFARHGLAITEEEGLRLYAEDGYCEPLLRILGARRVDSMDVSDYEKATIIHDLNCPWPEALREQFDVVIDAGTLEHVFNFPLAIANCMAAIVPGGRFLCITPANNALGHGFYQFSPELYFRIFVPENGFEIEKVLLFEHPWKSVWYEVSDPARIRSRVELVNRNPTYMIVCARKIAAAEVFAQPPVQSDYPLIYWQQRGSDADRPLLAPVSFFKGLVPEWAANRYRRLRPFRSRYFRKVRC